MDPEDIQRIQEAMPDIGTVRGFNVVEEEERSPDETTVSISGDTGGVRFPVDAIRAEDMAEFFERLAEDLAVENYGSIPLDPWTVRNLGIHGCAIDITINRTIVLDKC